MLITFIDSQGINQKEFLPDGTMMNAARYIEISNCFMKRLRRVRSQYARQDSWFFVLDNSRPQTANNVKQFLVKKREGRGQIGHPPYSPDLNLPDLFPFQRLKLP
ncbi:hypothetical protein NPIL_665121 [Nephila pilipes]|uniref:Transposase n=1 Tax=Nephila pilipes TaxID=299642 RepID=A0A8X6NFV3_NEPPI|nr:hypothetical protein NPIL_665121 [Nephila pilipes]